MARVTSNKPKPSTAKSRPALKSKTVESAELEVAPEKTVQFDNGVRKDIGSDIEIQGDVHGFADKAAKLAFMEEPVTVMLSESTDKNPERYVFISVNGIGAGPQGHPWVPRGVEITIKRKYLNVLAGARQVRYTNYEFTNNDGERGSAQRAASADIYPFSVIEDQNPRGREWLKQLRASRRAG
ncbi:MAG TPA: hypothetical protein VES38_06820 [Methylotenera sp.]|nr:hypothetical protein [Methylotenera sp.]